MLEDQIIKTEQQLKELKEKRDNVNVAHACFDIGNVLVQVNLETFTKELKKVIPSTHDPMFFLEYLQATQDIGLSTVQQALRAQHDIFEAEKVQILLEAWNATIEPNEMMLRFLENLRSDGVKMALLSNIGMEHATHLRKTIPDLFSNMIEHLSYEVGARKPSKIYFQSFLLDHQNFKGAIYIDDREDNLKSGKKYSLKTYKFCLDEILLMSLGKQKAELDKLKGYILDKKNNSLYDDI